MVAESGPSTIVDDGYAQADLIAVPTDLRSLFGKYEEAGVSWQMFLFMNTTERRLVHQHVGTDQELVLLIEKTAAASKQKERVNLSRSDCDAQISKWFTVTTAGSKYLDDREVSTGYEPTAQIESHTDPYDGASSSSISTFPNNNNIKSSVTSSSALTTVQPKLAPRFSGIVNQSSTCYLNALLQALFHLPVFRRTIYQVAVPEERDPKASVSLAMQQLFYNLQHKRGKNKTTNLTAAFGWDSQEAAVQHDIHELVRKLLDVLEANYSCRPGERNPIQRIFCGTKLCYSKCIDVDYTYLREETLYDVELVVKTHANIEESLKAETTAERLEGGNKYCWEHDDEPVDPVTKKHRKTYHDADRGSAFRELPPVLMIHPNRLDFDLNTFQKITVNSEWQFAETLDMSPYVIASEANPVANHVMLQRAQSTCPTEPDDATTPGMSRRETSAASTGGADDAADAAVPPPPQPPNPYMYDLRSVVIHSGAASYGHYYCYVNYDGDWVKFNDESVTDTTFHAMCKEAFGGVTTTSSGYTYPSSTRASLLVYVRRDQKDSLLNEVTDEDIPEGLKSFFEGEQGREARDAEEASRLARLCSVPVIRFDGTEKGFNELRLPKTATVSKLEPDQIISEGLEECTLWVMDMYFNYTVYYRNKGYEAAVVENTEKIRDRFAVPVQYQHSPSYQQQPTKALIAVPHSVASPPPPKSDKEEPSDWVVRLRGSFDPCLLVVYENTRREGIVFRAVVQTTEELVRRFYPTEEEGLDDSPQILIESTKKLYTVPNPSELYSGDIVVLARPSEGSIADAVRAFNLLHNYLDVTLYRMRSDQLPVGVVTSEPEDVAPGEDAASLQPTELATIRVVDSDSFDDVQKLVAPLLSDPNLDPRCIAFRSHDVNADAPHKLLLTRSPLDYYGRPTGNVRDVRGMIGDKQGIMVCKLYFEVLPLPVADFEEQGLRDYVAIDGTTKHRFVAKKFPVSLYPEHFRELRRIAADSLHVPECRIVLTSVNYDGVADSFSLDPYAAAATTTPAAATPATTAAAAAGANAGAAPPATANGGDDDIYGDQAWNGSAANSGDRAVSANANPLNSGTAAEPEDEWAQVNRAGPRRSDSPSSASGGAARGDDSDDADGEHHYRVDSADDGSTTSPAVQNPLSAGYGPANNAPAANSETRTTAVGTPASSSEGSTAFASAISVPRTDIAVLYSKPTYMDLDKTHFIVLPPLPPAEPYVPTPSPPPKDEDDDGTVKAAPALPPRWVFLALQHCVNRSRRDFFGFAGGLWVRDTDTGKEARKRVLDYLGVDEKKAATWKLLALKQASSTAMFLINDDTKISEVFSFSSTYFTGSLVLERPLPAGLAPRSNRVASAEPELRINAPRPSASTQDLSARV